MLLAFYRYLADCLFVTMPALLQTSAQQSPQQKPQNHHKSIYRSDLNLDFGLNHSFHAAKVQKNMQVCK